MPGRYSVCADVRDQRLPIRRRLVHLAHIRLDDTRHVTISGTGSPPRSFNIRN